MTRLQQERRRRDWTQQDLAFYARVTCADVSRWENGMAKPYPSQAARLAKTLGLDPADLLCPVEAVTDESRDVNQDGSLRDRLRA
ncbi:MAG: helix-turn-helix transcriptional regulator [Acidobacteria bacterium]|nr:helix-turn-helix transcriptional regulator [Acidobacteriota bacterium]